MGGTLQYENNSLTRRSQGVDARARIVFLRSYVASQEGLCAQALATQKSLTRHSPHTRGVHQGPTTLSSSMPSPETISSLPFCHGIGRTVGQDPLGSVPPLSPSLECHRRHTQGVADGPWTRLTWRESPD